VFDSSARAASKPGLMSSFGQDQAITTVFGSSLLGRCGFGAGLPETSIMRFSDRS